MNSHRPRFTSLLTLVAVVLMTLPTAARAGNIAASGVGGQNCTYTIGYWKTHPEQWPLATLTLGTITYTQAQLGLILTQPVQGNGLVLLSQQLIAAKLNVAQGADPAHGIVAMGQADALIGGNVCPPIGLGSLTPSQSSAIATELDHYNNGALGPFHCSSLTNARQGTWGAIKTFYR